MSVIRGVPDSDDGESEDEDIAAASTSANKTTPKRSPLHPHCTLDVDPKIMITCDEPVQSSPFTECILAMHYADACQDAC